MTELSDQQREAIEHEIFAGRKIAAIKLHREATGTGLAEAKKAVEGPEKTELEEAEKVGLEKAKEVDPEVKKDQ